MYTFLLIVVLGIWYSWRFYKRVPVLKKQDRGDQLADLIQFIAVATISALNTMKISSYVGRFFIFCMTFFVCTWIIQLLLEVVAWVHAYSKMLTLNSLFAILTPMIILWHMPKMNSMLEIELTFMTLLLSTGVVYGEVIHTVTSPSTKMNKMIRVKSILTWLGIILMNLYTLLVFIQFYMGVGAHHFIQNEHITEEAMLNLLYYLIITFTTVGFGDISPETVLGKIVTCFVAISGMLFTGMFMGAILSSDE